MKDVLIRAVRTWLQAFIGLLLASNLFTSVESFDPSVLGVAAVSAIPAALAVIQNWLEVSFDSDNRVPRG
jgi:hypothetical protein